MDDETLDDQTPPRVISLGTRPEPRPRPTKRQVARTLIELVILAGMLAYLYYLFA